MESKKNSPGQTSVEVVITPTPEEQQENKIVLRRKLDYHFLFTDCCRFPAC